MNIILKKVWRIARLLAVSIVVYILLYIPNSILGGYWWQPVAGKMEYAQGLSFHTLFLWQPYIGYSDSYNSDIVGLFFYPAIYVDQHYIHLPHDLMDKNGGDNFLLNNNHVKWHPKALEESKRKYLEKAIWRNRCIEDRAFCLQSATMAHTDIDTHLIALLIYDAYGTNSIIKLDMLSEKADSDFMKKRISIVGHIIQGLSSKTNVTEWDKNQ